MLRSLIHRLPLGWALRLALLRLLAQWQSLLTIVVGVLLAAVIGANAPLYTAAVAQVGMVQRLDQQPDADANIFSRISLTSLDVADLDATWTASDAAVRDQVGAVFGSALPGWTARTVTWAESAPMLVVRDGEDVEAVRMRVAYYDGWQEMAQIVEGEWPSATPPAGVDMDVALGLNASIDLGLEVGDVIVLDQRGWESSRVIRARISAVVREADDSNAYWMAPSPLRLEASGQYQAEANVLVSRADFLRAAIDFIPETRSLIGWRVLFDHTRLPFSETPAALARLEAFSRNLAELFQSPDGPQLNYVYQTNLPPLLTAYAAEVGLLGAPFGLLLLQIGALVLFFLVATATLVRRGERRELAMLQSRGAFDCQLILLRGVEALLITLLAALVGPVVAQQFLIGLAPVFTGIERLPLELDRSAFVFAALAGGAALLALMGTLRPVLRLPLILAGGSAARSDRQAWWQRYYLDVLLVIVGGAALWRLVSTSSPLSGTQLGGLEADPLLLLAPALLFVALGSVLLRLFPALMQVLARFFARRDGLGGALATWQVSREPVHYGRIAFLLTLAIGIGWFATSFRATVSRSQNDQARYQVGTDIRLSERDVALDVDRTRPADTFLAMDEVEAASAVMRFINADVSIDRRQPLAGEVLAIDSDSFGSVVYWRSDLGPVKAPRAPGQPVSLPAPGRALPLTPARIGLWARVDLPRFSFSSAGLYQPDLDRLLNRMTIHARLRDATGTFVTVDFDPVEVEWTRAGMDEPGLSMRAFLTTGWAYFEADLTGLPYTPQGELRLESIYWSNRGRANAENDVRLALAGLRLIDSGGAVTELNWLAQDGWDLVYDSGALIRGSTGIFTAAERPNLAARQIIWDQDGMISTLGIVFNYPEAGPIPAVASRMLMERNGLQPGDTYDLVNLGRVSPTIQVLDMADYYPTLYDERRPFLVVDQAALLYAINRRPSATVYPSEMWLRLKPGVSSQTFAAGIDLEGDSSAIIRTVTLDRTLRTIQTNPLALGLMGLLFLAFMVALALSVVGLLTYAGLTAQSRRAEFGVLRALGLSLKRLVISLALEQTLVMLTGTLLGGVLGALLSDRVVPTLAIGATGEAITPPFVVQVEAAALLQYGLIMLAVLAGVLTASLLLVRRLSLAQTLRLGEE